MLVGETEVLLGTCKILMKSPEKAVANTFQFIDDRRSISIKTPQRMEQVYLDLRLAAACLAM
jgi:hypothetical protein